MTDSQVSYLSQGGGEDIFNFNMKHKNQNHFYLTTSGVVIIVIVTAGVSFWLGQSVQKNKHHNEIRKMKRTVKELQSKISNH